MIGRLFWVIGDLTKGFVCLVWLWYCGLHWLVTGKNIAFDDGHAVVRYLLRNAPTVRYEGCRHAKDITCSKCPSQ